MSGELTADRLLTAVAEDRGDAGIVIEGEYRPAGDGKVMPPSFPEGPYLFESRWVAGEERRVVVLDQVPSQANRIEEALLAARDAERIELPLFELHAKTSRGPLRLTSLQFPHRYADAYLRDSLVAGERFDRSPSGGGCVKSAPLTRGRCMSGTQGRCCSALGIHIARASGPGSPACTPRR